MRTTSLIEYVAPRSTLNHSVSAFDTATQSLDQRVVRSPSTAEPGVPKLVELPYAVRPIARLLVGDTYALGVIVAALVPSICRRYWPMPVPLSVVCSQ